MELDSETERYIAGSQKELKDLIVRLCAIPAPSRHEEKRAEFCLDWFRRNGGADAFIDEAYNVLVPLGDTGENDLAVLMAHTDTVFPDTEPMPIKEKDGRLWCPGVCDDTANLAVLMIAARYFLTKRPPLRTGLVFVANSCEEGLGNLRGCRAVCARYGARMREFITLDGSSLSAVVDRAVGSQRWRVAVRTEGGHSFSDFGKNNAIRCLASMINTLYTFDVPRSGGSQTTYNVGVISGGTSVNTIAQEAEMLYEYRSDDRGCLEKMRQMFEGAVEAYRSAGIGVEMEKVGDRPCEGEVDELRRQALLDRAAASIRRTQGVEPVFNSGSTDCNIPLSLGVPSVCLGVCEGGGCHTREEYLELDSLLPGCRLFMDFLSGYSVRN